MGGSPLVRTGHGAPPADVPDDTEVVPPGVAFAAAAEGDGEAGGAFGPGVAGAFGAGEPGDAAGDPAAAGGEPAGEGDAVAPGDGAAGAGEPAFGGDPAAAGPDGATLGAGAPPCGAGEAAGVAAPTGGGLSCSAGARAPIFAMSWPMRIFPRNTGRSKM